MSFPSQLIDEEEAGHAQGIEYAALLNLTNSIYVF